MKRTPYEQVCEEIGETLQRETTYSDNLTLKEIWGDEITFYTRRVHNINKIVDYLPVIIVDVASAIINYPIYDQGYERAIPIVIVMYLPLDTEDMTPEERADAEELLDLKIKQLYTGMEEILNSASGKGGAMVSLELNSGSMPYESTVVGDSNTGRDAKVAILQLTATCLIAG